jgi:hypothetical protein
MVSVPSTAERGPTRSGYFALFGVITVAGVFAIVGVIVALMTFTTTDAGDAHHHDDEAQSVGTGEAIDTSFGSIVVENVDMLDGLTDEELGGMSHGIADYVAEDRALVSVAVLIVNESGHPVRVAPGDFALFADGSSEPIAPTSSTIQPLTLQPESSVDSTVTFAVPRSGAEVSFGYADPDGSVVLVPAGQLDQAPPDSPTDHHSTASDDDHDDGHDHDH